MLFPTESVLPAFARDVPEHVSVGVLMTGIRLAHFANNSVCRWRAASRGEPKACSASMANASRLARGHRRARAPCVALSAAPVVRGLRIAADARSGSSLSDARASRKRPHRACGGVHGGEVRPLSRDAHFVVGFVLLRLDAPWRDTGAPRGARRAPRRSRGTHSQLAARRDCGGPAGGACAPWPFGKTKRCVSCPATSCPFVLFVSFVFVSVAGFWIASPRQSSVCRKLAAITYASRSRLAAREKNHLPRHPSSAAPSSPSSARRLWRTACSSA